MGVGDRLAGGLTRPLDQALGAGEGVEFARGDGAHHFIEPAIPLHGGEHVREEPVACGGEHLPARALQALLFEPTGEAGVYRDAVVTDPLAGWPFVWVRISGNTLTVYSLLVHEDGSYEFQTYDRTLSAMGMDLRFTRVLDGELVRSVTGTLVKVGG